MLKQAKQRSEIARKMNPSEKGVKRKSNLVGMDGRYANAIAASIYARKNDGTLYKVLGEFEFNKDTNCGDLLEIGDRQFEVVKVRAQFKYAGGKKTVMVRKILEVKEIIRIAEERSLERLMKKDDDDLSPLMLE